MNDNHIHTMYTFIKSLRLYKILLYEIITMIRINVIKQKLL